MMDTASEMSCFSPQATPRTSSEVWVAHTRAQLPRTSSEVWVAHTRAQLLRSARAHTARLPRNTQAEARSPPCTQRRTHLAAADADTHSSTSDVQEGTPHPHGHAGRKTVFPPPQEDNPPASPPHTVSRRRSTHRINTQNRPRTRTLLTIYGPHPRTVTAPTADPRTRACFT